MMLALTPYVFRTILEDFWGTNHRVGTPRPKRSLSSRTCEPRICACLNWRRCLNSKKPLWIPCATGHLDP